MDKNDFVKMAYNNNQDTIKLLDQKITVLIAVLAIMFTAVISMGGDLACAWKRVSGSLCIMITILAILATLAMLWSIFCAGMVLLPRRPREIPLCKEKECAPGVGQMFWAHNICNRQTYPTFQCYWQAICDASNETRLAELAFEVMKTSDILVAKFTWSRRALHSFLVALVLWLVPLLFQPYIHSLVPKQ